MFVFSGTLKTNTPMKYAKTAVPKLDSFLSETGETMFRKFQLEDTLCAQFEHEIREKRSGAEALDKAKIIYCSLGSGYLLDPKTKQCRITIKLWPVHEEDEIGRAVVLLHGEPDSLELVNVRIFTYTELLTPAPKPEIDSVFVTVRSESNHLGFDVTSALRRATVVLLREIGILTESH